jgi:hypothetical protein
MAIYLAENRIGFDASLVGFPTLGSCMGLALQTDQGLFGFHVYGSDSNKAPAFNAYCTQHARYGRPVGLYGSCRWNKRYDGAPNRFVAWLTEIRALATQLNYRGQVTGSDLSTRTAGITDVGSGYVEYEAQPGGQVVIRYARMEDVDHPWPRTAPRRSR